MITEQHDQCCFCDIDSETIWLETEFGQVMWDGFSVSKGNTLVVPEFQIPSFHDLDSETQAALWKLVGEVRSRLGPAIRLIGIAENHRMGLRPSREVEGSSVVAAIVVSALGAKVERVVIGLTGV
jgi:diadenosine tetraphosphate (Ap4A) HIT family hydrolase